MVAIAAGGVHSLALVYGGVLQFSSAEYAVNENGSTVTITVTRVDGSYGAASVEYATTDGRAAGGGNYTAGSCILNWANGERGA